MTWLYVALGGALGSVGRYGFMSLAGRWWGNAFPYGTLGVNVVGGFAMGVLVALLARYLPPAQHEIRALVGVGLLGGFTTFSAFSLDAVVLYERGQWGAALAYVVVSVVASVAALASALYLFRPTMG